MLDHGVAHSISGKDHGGSPCHLGVRPWGSAWYSMEKTMGVAHGNFIYGIWYFGELIKHCAYDLCLYFRYFWFQKGELDVIASHPPVFHIL